MAVRKKDPAKQDPIKQDPEKKGCGLALSGGGYRASLFHIGALGRLNELGWLPKLDEIASVSGGSITSAYLGLRWKDLDFDGDGVARSFEDVFVSPLRKMCSTTIDVGAILGGLGNPVGTLAGRVDAKSLIDATVDGIGRFLPKVVVDGAMKPFGRLLGAGADAAAGAFDAFNPLPSPSENLINAYKRLLFGKATLQDLPDPREKGNPRFTIYATSLQSGVSFRMARDYMADYRLGKVDKPELELATAVAASSAFPPFFAPVEVHVGDKWESFESGKGDLADREELKRDLDLGDGAIYDNLGLERIWRKCSTVLVSDAGDPLEVQDRLAFDWLRQTLRATLITVNQVNQLRKRMLLKDFVRKEAKGTYWSTSSDVASYGLEKAKKGEPLIQDSEKTRELAKIRIRLAEFTAEEQELLIDWGYVLADTGMRRWVLGKAPKPGELPYPGRLP